MTITRSARAAGTITGVDLSQWQDGLDPAEIAAAGHRFAIVRACDGDHADPAFLRQAGESAAAGLHLGAYWYLRHPDEGSALAEQADAVAAQLARLGAGPRPGVWLDCETRPRLTAGQVRLAAGLLAERGVACAGMYASRGYWRLRRMPRIGGLWLAEWPGDPEPPAYPGDDHPAWRPVHGSRPDLWQYTDRGRVGGFRVDLSAFPAGAGGEPALARLLAGRLAERA